MGFVKRDTGGGALYRFVDLLFGGPLDNRK